ncbi:MAG: hypothetical protein PHR81_06605 [Bacteroidales bacterium]|jgi:hypothetical protein|nr:hypothetical protein [Bacteroidales bacterium]
MKIEYCLEKNNPELLSFMKETLRPFFTSEILEWQYYSNADSFLMTLKCDNAIKGTQGMLFHELLLSDNATVVDSSKSETTYVSAEFRGKGMFEELYKRCIDKTILSGHKFIWGFTGIPNVLKKKLGFHIEEEIIYEAKIVIGVAKIKTIRISEILSYAKNLFGFINVRIKILHFSDKKKLNVKDYDNLSKIMPCIHQEIKNGAKDICLNYSENYCDWRMDRHPVLKYKLLLFTDESDKKVAYVIYAVKNNAMMISSLNFTDRVFFNAVFCKIIDMARKLKLKNVNYFGNINNKTNAIIFEHFCKYGGKKYLNKGMSFVLKSNSLEDEVQYKNSDNWFINGLWTEGFTY